MNKPADKLSVLPTLPAGFVHLDSLIPDIVLDIRYFGADNFLAVPVEGYLRPQAIMTHPAALALLAVHTELRGSGLGLKIFDAYRPQRAVDHFLRWQNEPEDTAIAARFHPELSKPALFAQGYLAARSTHTRGSTADLTLVATTDNGHEELDMGTEFDFFGPQSGVHYTGITSTQRANRLLLRLLMERHGFRGFAMEWWHFTLNNEPYPNQYFDFPVS